MNNNENAFCLYPNSSHMYSLLPKQGNMVIFPEIAYLKRFKHNVQN